MNKHIKNFLILLCVIGYVVLSFAMDYVRSTSYAVSNTNAAYWQDYSVSVIVSVVVLVVGLCLSKEKRARKPTIYIGTIMCLFSIAMLIIGFI